MKYKALFALLVIFVVAYVLRILFLPQGALTFGYDQARDAYVSQEILKGDLKILGPPASTPGLYHGVFYYYFLAPSYLIGQGSPLVTAYYTAAFNAAVIFIVFYLAWLMTKKVGAALLAAFLFAISWESTQYATWLSNPTIGIWTVPFIYLGLWAWIKEKKVWGPIVTGLGLGLSIQADIFLAYHFPPAVLWLLVARKNIVQRDILKFAASFFLAVFTMILVEIKFGFQGLSGIANLAGSKDAIVLSRGLGDFITLYLNQLGKVFAYSSYPGNIGYGGAFVLIILILALISWDKKTPISWQPFLATWLFSHLTVVSVGGTSTPFLNVGFTPAIAILLGITLYNWWASRKRALTVTVLGILLFGNLSNIFRENPKGSTIFAIQKDMLLSKQLKAIDYTYEQANGRPFTVNSITSPLYINIVWTYLYKWYGLPKYGYTPSWHGPDQVGQLDTLTKTERSEEYYLISEPWDGIPPRFAQAIIDEENYYSNVVEEKDFGALVVQKRQAK